MSFLSIQTGVFAYRYDEASQKKEVLELHLRRMILDEEVLPESSPVVEKVDFVPISITIADGNLRRCRLEDVETTYRRLDGEDGDKVQFISLGIPSSFV